jgi:amino acid adenylation domain-containing protein
MDAADSPVLAAAVTPAGSPTQDPVLPAQQGMILNYLRFPDDGVDVIQVTLDWIAALEPEPFEAAWHLAAARHQVLRTAFRLDDRHGLVQVTGAGASIDIRWRDLPPPPASGPDHRFESFLRADRRDRFDVTRGPRARWKIGRWARRSDDGADCPAHRAVLTFHHALLDGHSLRLLVDEVSTAYASLRDGRAAPDPPPRPSFGEFVRWWHATDSPASEPFWQEYLAGTAAPRPLPGYLGPAVAGTAEPMMAETVLPRTDSELIRQAARAARLSSSTMVSAAWALLRARYGGTTDVVVAVTRSCRRDSIPGAETIVGPLINTVPLRIRFEDTWSVRDLLTAADDGIRQIREHQRTPMASALAWAGLAADTTLVDSLLVFDRRRLQAGLPAGAAAPSSARLDRLPSYPLMLMVYDEPELRLSLCWDRCRFADGSAERMLGQLRATLTEFAGDPAAPLADLDLGRADERDMLAGWNGADVAYPADATIPALFATHVARDPDATALIFGTAAMSYAELDRRSNALAWQLRRRGVGTDMSVAVAIQRGTDLIPALLAVLKAGAAYVPIEVGTPASRVAHMIATSGARLVLVTEQTAATVPQLAGTEIVRVDQIAGPAADERAAPPDVAHPLSLAYISFTSGSTGVPKGVAVPQRGVVRLVSEPGFAPLGPGQRLLQMSSVAFDVSTLEIWGALLTGGTVVVAPPAPLGLPDVASVLRTAGVTVAWLTAGLFHQVAETDLDALAGVPVVLAGGDVLSPDAVRAVLAARGGRPLVNGYGPTENTTFTTCYVMTEPGQVGPTVPIGRPIQHTTVHVLDQHGRPAPIGVTGELCTGGDGLARGYAGNAAATARAFVPDPSGHGTRLYRTGDLARWRADGILEFVGRLDDQVKIRGFRVEPGEVAAVLRAHPGVRDAVVVVAGDGAARHLIGYVTPADGVEPDDLRPSVLADFVAQRLPDYLVPAGFKAVDRLPLNASGKVDRAALPAPERESRAAFTQPRGATEKRLADVWRQLLPADSAGDDVDREDSFFALGGNSLLAARLMFRIAEVFDVELPMAAFYEASTLAACAAAIDAARPPDRVAALAPRPAAAPSGIGRRDRSAYRVAAAPAPDQPAAPPAPPGIGRRDRRAYRVAAAPAPDQPAPLAPHLERLAGDWALWRTVCLRAAGFPVHLVAALGDAGLADAADAAIAARTGADPAARRRADDSYAAEFTAAVSRLSAALHEAASLPALREAVAWQNRHALTTGIDVLRRHGPRPDKRNTKRRQHEALVASYVQRYCAKNDTIGFFGPVGWSQIDDGHGLRITHAVSGRSLADRVTYLEGWGVREIMAGHVTALRPWLVPRRMPFLGLDGTLLRLPLAPPVPLTPAEAAVLRACDGSRDARAVAALVLADPGTGLGAAADVFALMARLADSHRLAWQVDVAPQDLSPERSMRAVLSRVTDDGVREPAETALDELTAARDELAGAAGDAQQVAAAMAGLEATFTRLAGVAPTRRAGELYAGRTLAYEECLRADTVRLGADTLDGLRGALALVLDSARWFTTACGELYAQHFDEAYRQRAAALGTDIVPFTDVWLIANHALFDQPPRLIEPAMDELRQRWASLLDLPPDARRIQLRAADLAAAVAAQFPARPLPWPMAVHHSPDLMIAGAEAAAGGPLRWVLGEVHPSVVTSRYATWLAFDDAPDDMHAGMRHDLRGPAVWYAESAEKGGTSTRLCNVLPSPGDLRFVYAHDSCGYDPAQTLTVGDCDLVGSPAGLRVRRRDGTFERSLLEVVGDLICTTISHCFSLVPPGAHAPRVTVDDLVVSRETWRLPATDPAFAGTADESARYLQARAWAAGHGLPRHVFLRFTGERKPIYADLTSLASIDLIARAVRRSRRSAGAEATVTVVEMLPAPDEAWLFDAQGQRYSAELRMVAADQKTAGQRQEG